MQLWVLRGAGLDVREAEVIALNRDYVYDGVQLDIDKLFIRHSVTDRCNALQGDVGAGVQEMLAMLGESTAPDIAPGATVDLDKDLYIPPATNTIACRGIPPYHLPSALRLLRCPGCSHRASSSVSRILDQSTKWCTGDGGHRGASKRDPTERFPRTGFCYNSALNRIGYRHTPEAACGMANERWTRTVVGHMGVNAAPVAYLGGLNSPASWFESGNRTTA